MSAQQSSYIELVKQSQEDNWNERKWITVGDLNSVIEMLTADEKHAYYCSAFPLLLETETMPDLLKPEDKPEVNRLFEFSRKTGDFYLDFDCKDDLSKAASDVRMVVSYLMNSFGFDESEIGVWFSGNKGYHLTIPFECTGLDPRADLHELYGRMCKSLQPYAQNGTLDIKIYNARRLFRLPNSKHLKSGHRKSRVDTITLQTRNDTPWLRSTLKPQELFRKALQRIETKVEEKLESQARFPKEFYYRRLDCIEHVLNEGLPDGIKNDGAFTTALYLKGIGLNRSETEVMLLKSALVSKCGFDKRELGKTVTSAFNSEFKFGLKDSVLDDYITEDDRRRWKGANLEDSYVDLSSVSREFLSDLKSRKGRVAKYFVEPLDDLLGGINSGELVVIGAGTGVGKSEFAFNVCLNNAKAGIPTGFITLEVPNRDFVARMVRGRLGLSQSKFWSGELTKEEMNLIEREVEDICTQNIPLFFRKRKSSMGAAELEQLASSLVVEQHCRLLGLDHIHYMNADRDKFSKDTEHVKACVHAINTVANTYDIGILGIAHLSKQYDPYHRPRITEFKDSSAIEQVAHTAIMLWRDTGTADLDLQCVTEFNVAKNRKDVPNVTLRAKFERDTRTYVALPSEVPYSTRFPDRLPKPNAGGAMNL